MTGCVIFYKNFYLLLQLFHNLVIGGTMSWLRCPLSEIAISPQDAQTNHHDTSQSFNFNGLPALCLDKICFELTDDNKERLYRLRCKALTSGIDRNKKNIKITNANLNNVEKLKKYLSKLESLEALTLEHTYLEKPLEEEIAELKHSIKLLVTGALQLATMPLQMTKLLLVTMPLQMTELLLVTMPLQMIELLLGTTPLQELPKLLRLHVTLDGHPINTYKVITLAKKLEKLVHLEELSLRLNSCCLNKFSSIFLIKATEKLLDLKYLKICLSKNYIYTNHIIHLATKIIKNLPKLMHFDLELDSNIKMPACLEMLIDASITALVYEKLDKKFSKNLTKNITKKCFAVARTAFAYLNLGFWNKIGAYEIKNFSKKNTELKYFRLHLSNNKLFTCNGISDVEINNLTIDLENLVNLTTLDLNFSDNILSTNAAIALATKLSKLVHITDFKFFCNYRCIIADKGIIALVKSFITLLPKLKSYDIAIENDTSIHEDIKIELEEILSQYNHSLGGSTNISGKAGIDHKEQEKFYMYSDQQSDASLKKLNLYFRH